MQKPPITAWWGIPCKSMVPVFRALKERHGRDVLFVALQDLPANRKRLGWELPLSGEMPFRMLGEEGWRDEIITILSARDGLHIVNGVYHHLRVRHVVERLIALGKPYSFIMEAPSNMQTGMRRLAKKLVAPVVTPLRTWKAARGAQFVLSASGDREPAFRRLGFRAGRIFPFGYFPDYPPLERAPADPGRPHLLCIGYLEPFKGQDILLEAISILRRRGTEVFCTVTGFGSARDRLLAQRERLGLAGCVDFPGVVSNGRLAELFRDCSMLAAPGLEEPWGIRVNEALLAGMPVVVSDGVGAKEIVQSTGGGEVFRSGDPASLAGAIATTLARLGPGGDLIAGLLARRNTITPAAAADYLESVIAWNETAGPETARPPLPQWLPADAPSQRT